MRVHERDGVPKEKKERTTPAKGPRRSSAKGTASTTAGRASAPDAAAGEQFLALTTEGVWRYDVAPSVSTKLPPEEQAGAILARARLGFCNEAFARLYGFARPDELVGLPLSGFLAGTEEEKLQFVAQSVRSGYRFENVKVATQMRDGRVAWTTNSVAGIVRRGRLVGGWGTSHNITAEKAAEAELREAHAELHATLTAFPDLLFEIDAAGRFYGYHAQQTDQLYAPPEAFLGKTVSEILPREAADVIFEALAEATRNGLHRGAKYRLDMPDGRRWFDLSIAAKPHTGQDKRFIAVVREITAQEEAAGAIQASEERLALALAATSDGVYDVNFVSGVTHYSPSYATMLGFAPEELPPSQATWEALLHPEDRDRALARLDDCLRGRSEEYEMEFRLRTKSGDWRWILSRGRVVERDAAGMPLRIVGTHRDITSRVLIRDELRRERDRAEAYLDIAGVVLIALDRRGLITLLNQRGCRLLGYETSAEAIGRSWFDVHIANGKRTDKRRTFAEIMTGNRALEEDYESEVVTRAGEPRLIAWHNTILRDDEGRVLGTLSSGEDITERREAERALQQSEERFRRIFEVSPIGIVMAGTDHLFTRANEAFCRMIGYSEEELRALRFTDITHPDHREADLAGVERAVRGDIPAYRTEKRYVCKDGHVVWGSVASAPVRDVAGKVQHFLAMVEDITARKTAETALADSERRYRELANDLPTCVFEVDSEGRVVYVNQTGFTWFGYRESDLAERPSVTDMVVPAERERARRALRRAATEGEVPAGVYVALRRDGTTFPALVSSRAILREGDVVGVRGILVDISERVEAARRIERALEGTVLALAATTEMRDPYTAGHQERVTRLALAIGRRMGCSDSQLEGLRVAGLLHDVGKASVPSEILSKPTVLTAIEMSIVRQHAETGHAILKAIDFPWPVAKIVLQHHERMDGSGYPTGLMGDAILLEARILAIADTVEAMASHRPYRAALEVADALQEIRQGRGTLYDAAAVDACIQVFELDGFGFDAK